MLWDRAIFVVRTSVIFICSLGDLGTIKMNYALVRRTVTDVAKWRAAYAEYAPKRAEAGLSDTMVLYSVDKPNEVWTLHGAQDLAALHKFTATIRPVMQQTGLQDEPDFYYLTDYRDATDRDSFGDRTLVRPARF